MLSRSPSGHRQQIMEASMEPKFLFVEASGASKGKVNDREARRSIRKHIMRDIGRSRRKKPRNPQFELQLAAAVEAPSPLRGSASDSDATIAEDQSESLKHSSSLQLSGAFWEQHPLAMISENWGVDPFVAYGLAMAISASKNKPWTHAGCFWFPFAFQDSQFFLSMLTGPHIQQSFFGEAMQKSQDLGLARYNSNLSSLQKALADPDHATSDNVIRGIIGLVCYNYVTRDFAQAEVHLAGLERMVELRGGVSTFKGAHELWLMLFWIDTTAALLRDKAPRFPLPPPEVLPVMMRPPQVNALSLPFARIADVSPGPPQHSTWIISSLYELKAIAVVLENEVDKRGEGLWKDEVFMGMRLNPVAHRLLRPKSESFPIPKPDGLWEATRLGCLMFIIALKQKSHTFPDSDARYASRILAALDREALNHVALKESAYVALKLWLLVMCAVSSASASDHAAATIAIVEMMQELQLGTWQEVMTRVRTMPWVDLAFDIRSTGLEEDVLRLKGG